MLSSSTVELPAIVDGEQPLQFVLSTEDTQRATLVTIKGAGDGEDLTILFKEMPVYG